ncbi:hypothetical protein MXD61_06905 [Frankia sp. AgPm24]|uniref:hypothetical protein n=1 Tax=Frankia sp. AgPm24 TaxID=631128 RepID=UPI00200E2BC4|nr:hypothetical protein [Frankia sp. AgPm24]MCK9921620.1 hypothetical protein [Frankia sp. AgPm24]
MIDYPEAEFDLDHPGPADDKAQLMALELAEDEARAAQETDTPASDPVECVAEYIDGYCNTEECDCEECRQETWHRIEALVEQGEITEGEAHARHALAGTL